MYIKPNIGPAPQAPPINTPATANWSATITDVTTIWTLDVRPVGHLDALLLLLLLLLGDVGLGAHV